MPIRNRRRRQSANSSFIKIFNFFLEFKHTHVRLLSIEARERLPTTQPEP